MTLRSLLFVPGDSERKLSGATRHGADALILDLEDTVAPARKPVARQLVHDYLASSGRANGPACWVRINAWSSGEALADLAAVMPGGPAGIVLPKSEPATVTELDQCLTAYEAASGLAAGQTKIIAIATETPRALFEIGYYGGRSARLLGLTWGSEDLAAALGAINRGPQGYEDTFRLARSLCVLGAGAAGVEAIDAACMEYGDTEVFAAECRDARRAGFTAKLAIHPRQVAIINTTFAPSAEELAWARRVVAAFHANPELGVVGIDGKVIDRPHLQLAERLLARQ